MLLPYGVINDDYIALHNNILNIFVLLKINKRLGYHRRTAHQQRSTLYWNLSKLSNLSAVGQYKMQRFMIFAFKKHRDLEIKVRGLFNVIRNDSLIDCIRLPIN